MAIGVTRADFITVVQPAKSNYTIPLTLMVSLYFGIGFITALNDILVPHFKDLFHLSNKGALLVQFCFFTAYFVMSLPSGWIIGRIGYKKGIVLALAVMGLGLLLFLPASVIIFYPLFLFALFVVGSGLALLQVAINPYVGALGMPETAASRINLCGFFNSSATTIAPKLGAVFIFIAAGATTVQLARSVRTPYLILAVCAFAMATLVAFVHLPDVIERGDDNSRSDGSAWRFNHLRLGALAIFFYVGAEVAIGSILIIFLGQPSMGGLTHSAAAPYVSYYWGSCGIGRLIGFFALQRIRAQRALAFVSLIASVLVIPTFVAHRQIAMRALLSCRLFTSTL